jgi:DNA-binding response OmpR family regulator
MSGIELQQLLLNRSDPVPIIFITANTADNLRIQALRNGALAYFYKPFDSGILLKVVRAAATRSERLVANFQ